MAERIAVLDTSESAQQWAARVAPLPMAPHDPVTGPLAVDLAARGVIPEKTLPLELRVELAARRREPPPAVDAAALDKQVVDAKHALLWHLLVDPNGAQAKTLLARMHGAADRDPIIGFALARAALAAAPSAPGASDVWAPVLRAIAASPSHPLLLAVAVEPRTSRPRAHASWRWRRRPPSARWRRSSRRQRRPGRERRRLAKAQTPAERVLASE